MGQAEIGKYALHGRQPAQSVVGKSPVGSGDISKEGIGPHIARRAAPDQTDRVGILPGVGRDKGRDQHILRISSIAFVIAVRSHHLAVSARFSEPLGEDRPVVLELTEGFTDIVGIDLFEQGLERNITDAEPAAGIWTQVHKLTGADRVLEQ